MVYYPKPKDINQGLNAVMAELEEADGNWFEAARQYDIALLHETNSESQAYYRKKREQCFNLLNASKAIR